MYTLHNLTTLFSEKTVGGRSTKAYFISCMGKTFFSFTKPSDQVWSPPRPF